MQFSDIPTKRIETHSVTCANSVVQILQEVFFANQPADKALASLLKANHQFGSRDRRIISETLYSVLRWWGWLRHLAPAGFVHALEQKSPLPPDIKMEEWNGVLCAAWLLEGRPELPPSAQWWLHHSSARINDLPQLPPEASITERRKYLRPFFGKDEDLPAFTLESLMPGWCQPLVESPVEWMELIKWQQQRPPVWLRAQINDVDKLAGELKRSEVRTAQHPQMKHALKAIFSGLNLRQLPPFLNGWFEVQDLASQVISLVCAPCPGQRWWDACAGAGGKTLHLAGLMQGKGTITATDNRAFKLEELKLRARRCNFSNIITKEWLGIDVPRYHQFFNGVLVDAPCTCSGVWRRNPWLKWTTSQPQVQETVQLQKQLLENGSHAVAPNGTLVYATCSMFKQENQEVVEDFLSKHPEFELMPFTSPLDGSASDGMLQIWPWQGDCDAMFVAKLHRKDN